MLALLHVLMEILCAAQKVRDFDHCNLLQEGTCVCMGELEKRSISGQNNFYPVMRQVMCTSWTEKIRNKYFMCCVDVGFCIATFNITIFLALLISLEAIVKKLFLNFETVYQG